MRTITGVAAAGLIAVAVLVWLNDARRSITDSTVGRATLAPSLPPVSMDGALAATINIMEMHNRAHLENLPLEEVDDQSVIFSREARR